jgi:hypothetical protein
MTLSYQQYSQIKAIMRQFDGCRDKQQIQGLELLELQQRQRALEEKLHQLFEVFDLPYKPLTDIQFLELGQHKYVFAKQLQDLVILACYIFQPALRNDWVSLRIVNQASDICDGNNYLYMTDNNTMRLVMTRYRNSQYLGKQIIDVLPDLRYLLQIWVDLLTRMLPEKPEYILMYHLTTKKIYYQSSGDAMRRQIPRITNRLFGVHMSINDFRHLWDIDFQQNPKWNYQTLNRQQRTQLHNQMLHSKCFDQPYSLKDILIDQLG